jgi:hypothetical protein
MMEGNATELVQVEVADGSFQYKLNLCCSVDRGARRFTLSAKYGSRYGCSAISLGDVLNIKC